MKTNNTEKLIFGIFSIIGILLLIIGIFVCINVFDKEGKVEITGVISKIVTYENRDDEIDHTVYISYEVDGVAYESILNSYSSSFYEGKEIEIYYYEDNPNKIGSSSMDLVLLVMPGIGFIFLLIGGLYFFFKIKKKRAFEKLKVNGDLIYATYIGTEMNSYYTVNGRHPYVIVCKWLNPADGKEYLFKSENLWSDPAVIITQNSIQTFPVYITRGTLKPYYMDIDVLKNYIPINL